VIARFRSRRRLPDVVLAAELLFHTTTAYDILRHKARRLENAISWQDEIEG